MANETNNAAAEPLEYCGILACAEELAELDAGRVAVSIQRSAIVRADLRWGWQAERPVLMLVFGVAFVGIGLAPVPLVVNWMLHGGTISAWFGMLMGMGVFGGWCVYKATRRGFILLVETPGDRRKLVFSRQATRDQIADFLARAEASFGYAFERESLASQVEREA